MLLDLDSVGLEQEKRRGELMMTVSNVDIDIEILLFIESLAAVSWNNFTLL